LPFKPEETGHHKCPGEIDFAIQAGKISVFLSDKSLMFVVE
jgi:hypothetical protein